MTRHTTSPPDGSLCTQEMPQLPNRGTWRCMYDVGEAAYAVQARAGDRPPPPLYIPVRRRVHRRLVMHERKAP
jgi:hypothetical protein